MEKVGAGEGKPQELLEVVNGALPKAVKQLELASGYLPADKDFHFYSNFKEFKSPVMEVRNRVVTALSQITSWKEFHPSSSSPTTLSQLTSWKEFHPSSAKSPSTSTPLSQITSWKEFHPSSSKPWPADSDDAYDMLVGIQDDLLEQVDACMDKSLAEKKENQQKKAELLTFQPSHAQVLTVPKDVRVARKGRNDAAVRSPVPFHVRNIPRPQDKFDIAVDNSNTPFLHPNRLEGSSRDQSAASGYDAVIDETDATMESSHPLKDELSQMSFVEPLPETIVATYPEALEQTPFTFVETLLSLRSMAEKLQSVSEIAVDLENHHYRSYQGFVCLMQVSTREEDFIVDTLALRSHIAACLSRIFSDTRIRKVMHGADRDVVWLQRDFGIYVCNMFDTGQAARILQLPSFGLAYLLENFCGVMADKRYQLADWRIRPLPAEMVKYAREDTHYLLYIHDLLKQQLQALGRLKEVAEEDPWMLVCRRSRDICLQLYTKELFTQSSFLNLHGLYEKQFRPDQISAVAKLYAWRDQVARREDESTGYVLPNHLLFQIATEMPEDVRQLQMIAKWPQTYVGRNAAIIINLLREAKENPWLTPLQPRFKPEFKDSRLQEVGEEQKIEVSSFVETGALVVFTAEDGDKVEGLEIDAFRQKDGDLSTGKGDVFADIAQRTASVVVSRKAGSMLFSSRISNTSTTTLKSVAPNPSTEPATSVTCLGTTQPDAVGSSCRDAVPRSKEVAPAEGGKSPSSTVGHQLSPDPEKPEIKTVYSEGLAGNETNSKSESVVCYAETREEDNGSSVGEVSTSTQLKDQIAINSVPEVKLKGRITGFGASLFGRSKKTSKEVHKPTAVPDQVQAMLKVQAIVSSIALPFRTTTSGDQASVDQLVCSSSVADEFRGTEVEDNFIPQTGNPGSLDVQDENGALGDKLLIEEGDENHRESEAQDAGERHRKWWPLSRAESMSTAVIGGSGDSRGKKLEKERDSGTNVDQEDHCFPPSISDTHRTHKRRKRKNGGGTVILGGAMGTQNPTDQKKKSKVDEANSGKVISLDACALNGSFNYAEARKRLGIQNVYIGKGDEQHGRSQIRKGKFMKNFSSSNKYQSLGFDALGKSKVDHKPEGIPNAPRRQVFSMTGNRTATFKD
ncbi:hypothetical protein R1flu_024038 [Riccia fluitans]|uniref:HRDC domain-containing protein n=1 Tax=Riccia fluitans TaxID=41844 RepID=A0ABD1XWN6_9MARC